MAKKRDEATSFDFGYNVTPKKPRSTGGKKPRSAAQKAAAAFYAQKNRRRR
jgi:hypothetical protein